MLRNLVTIATACQPTHQSTYQNVPHTILGKVEPVSFSTAEKAVPHPHHPRPDSGMLIGIAQRINVDQGSGAERVNLSIITILGSNKVNFVVEVKGLTCQSLQFWEVTK